MEPVVWRREWAMAGREVRSVHQHVYTSHLRARVVFHGYTRYSTRDLARNAFGLTHDSFTRVAFRVNQCATGDEYGFTALS